MRHPTRRREPGAAGAIARLEDRGVRVGQPDGDPDFHFDKVCVLTAPDSLREEFLAEAAPMCQVIDRGNMLELPVRGYSKASGCLAVAQALGEDLADCYAIGDSANDLEMLQCVGHPLVMGNAPARVQAVAEYVTGTPAEDGLYHAMVHAACWRNNRPFPDSQIYIKAARRGMDGAFRAACQKFF